METSFKTKIIKVDIPEGCNIIFGMSHFIKTVEDIYEALVSSSLSIKFGIAFCEASMKRLIRVDGNDIDMMELATKAADDVGAGHSFFIYMKDAFPINVLNRVKNVQEVCRIFCATANPTEVILAQSELGRGILGVIDGESPKGIEGDEDIAWRKGFLRQIGYKL